MREVARGTVTALTLKTLGLGLSLSYNLILARKVGSAGAGLYFLAATMAAFATVCGRLGLDNALLRLIAAHAVVEDWPALRGVYARAMMLALGASTLVGGAMLVMGSWLANSVFSKPLLTEPFRLMAISVVPVSLLLLHSEALKGLKKVFASQVIPGVILPGTALVILGVLGGWGVRGAAWSYVLAASFTAFVAVYWWGSATGSFGLMSRPFDSRELLRSSLPLLWVNSLDLALSWIPLWLLGIWGTDSDVGVFGIATRIAAFTSFVLVAANSIVAPKFAEFYRLGDTQSLASTARNSTAMMTALAVPIAAILMLFPGWIMGLFGGEFRRGAFALAILTAGQFVNVSAGSVGYLLMMTKNERLLRNAVISAAALGLALSAFLIPSYGITGAAIASAVSLASINVIGAIMVYSKLGIVMLPLIRPKRAAVAWNSPSERSE
jgi:O-antigen/teichoic acid export membrane protein